MWPAMSFRKVLASGWVSEFWIWWMYWNITGVKPAYYPMLFWSMWCPKFPLSARDQFCILSRIKKSMALFHIKKFLRSCYITFKKKTSMCGSQVDHMWVTSGLFSGSSGSTGVTHFHPCLYTIFIHSYGFADEYSYVNYCVLTSSDWHAVK